MPDSASLQLKPTTTSWLYQPWVPGVFVDADTVGGAVSIESVTLPVAQFPSPSQARGLVITWFWPVVFTTVSGSGPGWPELGAGSTAVQWTVTGPLYQPFAFGAVVGVPVTVGGVVSAAPSWWTKTSSTVFVSPLTRSPDELWYATSIPSPSIDGLSLSPVTTLPW